LLLHIVDITNPLALEQSRVVEETLEELGAADKPVVVALNKIDLLPDPERIQGMLKGFRNSLAISAKEGMGLDELLSRISLVLRRTCAYFSTEVIQRINQRRISDTTD